MRLTVELELVDEVEGKLFFQISGINKMVGLTQLQVDVLESSEPDLPGMTTVDAIALARHFASELSEALIPLCVDFGGASQGAVGPAGGPLAAPVPVAAQAPKPSPAAPVAKETAPMAPAPIPIQPTPAQADSTVEEELEALGIETGTMGGGKRDDHPFSSTTTQE